MSASPSFDEHDRTASVVPGPSTFPRIESASGTSFVRATGRARGAGYCVSIGGLGVAISGFLPWVSVLGVASIHLAGGSVALLLGVGGTLAYFGVRILRDMVSRAVMTVVWCLAALSTLMIVGLFEAQSHITADGAGVLSPGAGLYVAILGLIAAVVGTAVLQLARRGLPSSDPRQDKTNPRM